MAVVSDLPSAPRPRRRDGFSVAGATSATGSDVGSPPFSARRRARLARAGVSSWGAGATGSGEGSGADGATGSAPDSAVAVLRVVRRRAGLVSGIESVEFGSVLAIGD